MSNSVNQLELHPWFASPALQQRAKQMGVLLTGYGTGNALAIANDGLAPGAAAVAAIAKRIGRSPMQVLLRWTLQRGVVAVPRSRDPVHIRENADIFTWMLTEEDMAALDAFDRGNHPYYWDPLASLATTAFGDRDMAG